MNRRQPVPAQPNVFELVAPYPPAGDQPGAIAALTQGIEEGNDAQVLMGVTGSGKTFTMANVIARIGRPTLVLSHNKTLAAQLYAEFRDFFPHNAVHYFVSYYDYYQPEAYIPQRDIYIEKDAAINKEIDRLRLAATSALVSRRDVIDPPRGHPAHHTHPWAGPCCPDGSCRLSRECQDRCRSHGPVATPLDNAQDATCRNRRWHSPAP